MTRARDLAAFVSNADGDIKFDTDTLFIDSSANRVGIGLTDPANSLSVKGGAHQLDVETSATGVTLESIDRAALSDSSDIAYYARNGNHQFFTGSYTERMRIDDSGRMGVNTTPDGWSSLTGIDVGQSAGFHGHASDEAAYVSNNLYFDGSNWKAKNTDESQLILLTSTSGSNHIGFYANASVSADANVTLDEHLRIDSDGLKFNGDTAAANALDDYEEGTFTPTLKQSSSNPTSVTYDFQTGRYTKIGNLCFIMIDVGWSAITSGSGVAQITMPFAAVSGEYNAFTARSHTGISGLASGKVFSGYSGGSEINMQLVTLSTGQEGNAGWASSGRLNISGVIRTT